MESNPEFWSEHSLEGIDPYFLTYSHIWEGAELVISDYSNLNKCFYDYQSKVPKSKYIKKVVPIFSKFQVVESMDRLKCENDYIEVVTTKSIIDSIKDSNIGDEFFKFVRQSKIKLYLSETVDNFYFVCADTFASLFLFDCDGDFDNLNMLLVTDPLKVRAANELFEIYKNNLKF